MYNVRKEPACMFPNTISAPSVWHSSFFLLYLTCIPSVVCASHSVTLQNFCGTGTPVLDEIPSIVLATDNGAVYTNDTINAVAFLNTGDCGPNGGECTSVDLELGLVNGSSTAIIDLVPTHQFSVPVSFAFYNGCDGSGETCSDINCVNAQRSSTPGMGLVECAEDGASVLVQFCPGNATSITSAASSISTSSSTSLSSSSTSLTSSSVSSSSSSSKNSIIGPVVGAVIGGLAALILLVLCLIYLRHHRSQTQKPVAELVPFMVENTEDGPYNPYTFNDTIPSPYTPQQPAFNPSKSSFADLTPKVASASEPTSIVGASRGLEMESQLGGSILTQVHNPTHSISPLSSVQPTETSSSQTNNLDQIIDGLARRFGWTQPPSDQDPPPPIYQQPNQCFRGY